MTAHRGDRHIEALQVHLVRFDGEGRVAEFWNTSTDEDEMDRFLA